MSDARTCDICACVIERDAPITLCPGCGALYHDGCYGSPADCVREACRQDTPPKEGASAAAVTDTERRVLSVERASLPNRVKSGVFTSSGLSLETGAGRGLIEWGRVELLALGIIEEAVGNAEAQKSGLRSMVRKMFFGENQSEQQRVRKTRDVFLLDIFVADQSHPYRVDGATVNYRAFLGEVSYASGQNFHRLVTRIVRDSAEARLDASLLAFLHGQREKIRRYGAVYDFEMESAQNRERLHALVPRREVQLDPERSQAESPASSELEENP